MTPKEQAEKNRFLCMGCTKCCEHIAIEIDKPKSKDDFKDVIWYVLHENVFVFVDHDDDWLVEFRTRCDALTKDNQCSVYDERPNVCREYDQEECERYSADSPYKFVFRTRDDILEYIKEHTKIKSLF